MRLTAKEYQIIFEALQHQYGMGYAKGDVGVLQAKLSIMAEVAQKVEAAEAAEEKL